MPLSGRRDEHQFHLYPSAVAPGLRPTSKQKRLPVVGRMGAPSSVPSWFDVPLAASSAGAPWVQIEPPPALFLRLRIGFVRKPPLTFRSDALSGLGRVDVVEQ